MLIIIHGSRLGIVKCKQLGRDILYWPGMNSHIEEIVSRCADCQENKKCQQKEPMMSTEIPERPWELISADLLYCCAKNWLVITDHYSDFIEIEELVRDTHSQTVIEKFAKVFAVHGKTAKLITDNGPQFWSHQFKTFTDEWEIEHAMTSPEYHQSNGKVERSNQTVRHRMEKMQGNMPKFYSGLLQLRNTPNPNVSPAQRLMSRRTATKLPTSTLLLQPQIVKSKDVQDNIQKRQTESMRYFKRNARQLEPLKQEDIVRVRVDKKWK